MNYRSLFSISGLVATGVFLLVSVAVISSLFPRLRIDLTQDNLYTLADGTRNIISDLDRPVELLFFYSEDATADMPQLRTYGQRVQELLREMVIASNGNLSMQVIDPEPFSVEEELATGYGVRAVPMSSGGEEVYFGIVARDATTVDEQTPDERETVEAAGPDDEEVFETMPLIRPDQEQFLEYEFSRLITQVIDPEPDVVGLLSPLSIDGGFDPQQRRATQSWAIMDSIRHLYRVRKLEPAVGRIDEDIDILMIVHPQGLPEHTRYAIDQFVLDGGRAMVFVDPSSDIQTRQAMAGGSEARNFSSDLDPLLQAWGVDYDPGQVVTDEELALFVNVGQQSRNISHIGMLGLRPPNFASDMVTSQLQVMNMSSAGALSPMSGADIGFDPLLRSSRQSTLMDSGFFEELTDPTVLSDEFSPDEDRYTLAARVTGPARTAFPDGRPASPESAPSGTGLDLDISVDEDGQASVEDTRVVEEDEQASSGEPPHRAESREDINVIVVADSDLLADRLWARRQQVAGERVTRAFASNADFVINSLDNLSGSTELISIRSRGSYARPFTRVIELQRAADERLREEETNLLNRLQETEQQIARLSQGGDASGGLTPQQQEEIERFMQQELETRRRLREVRHQLNDDIESLGARLKLINTALVPTLVVIVALVAGYLRRRRRSAASSV